MTPTELAEILAYISVAIGKPLGANPEDARNRAEVYFDLLGDLPKDVLQTAAKRVCLEHKWASFPTVAELREAAALTIRGQTIALSPAEAWNLASRAAGRIDLWEEGAYDPGGSVDRACRKLPPLVMEAMRAFGLAALVYGKEPLSIVRAQFIKIFEQLASREQKQALLPASVKRAVEQIGREQEALPAVARKAIANIGREVDA